MPSALCGITGIKPTFGRVPKSGVVPLSWSFDHVGPMARTARDCALMLDVLAGHDPSDPLCADVATDPYAAGLDGSVAGLRIGVLRHHHVDAPFVDASAIAAFESALPRSTPSNRCRCRAAWTGRSCYLTGRPSGRGRLLDKHLVRLATAQHRKLLTPRDRAPMPSTSRSRGRHRARRPGRTRARRWRNRGTTPRRSDAADVRSWAVASVLTTRAHVDRCPQYGGRNPMDEALYERKGAGAWRCLNRPEEASPGRAARHHRAARGGWCA